MKNSLHYQNNMKYMNKKIIVGILALMPAVTFAAGKDLKSIISIAVEYLNIGVSLIIALAVATFVWNVYIYFFTETKERKDAGMYVLYSVIGFFVILSFWGLVAILRNSLKLEDQRPADLFNIGSSSNGGSNGGSSNSGSTLLEGGSNPTDKLH